MVEFRILGPLEVVEDDRPLVLGGPKQRALLAVLLLHRGEVVSTDRLIDQLWGERPPASAAKSVQVYVSNLRKALGDGLLATRGRGYLLHAANGTLDLDRFEALVAQGRDALEGGDAHAVDGLRARRDTRAAIARLRAPLWEQSLSSRSVALRARAGLRLPATVAAPIAGILSSRLMRDSNAVVQVGSGVALVDGRRRRSDRGILIGVVHSRRGSDALVGVRSRAR